MRVYDEGGVCVYDMRRGVSPQLQLSIYFCECTWPATGGRLKKTVYTVYSSNNNWGGGSWKTRLALKH